MRAQATAATTSALAPRSIASISLLLTTVLAAASWAYAVSENKPLISATSFISGVERLTSGHDHAPSQEPNPDSPERRTASTREVGAPSPTLEEVLVDLPASSIIGPVTLSLARGVPYCFALASILYALWAMLVGAVRVHIHLVLVHILLGLSIGTMLSILPPVLIPADFDPLSLTPLLLLGAGAAEAAAIIVLMYVKQSPARLLGRSALVGAFQTIGFAVLMTRSRSPGAVDWVHFATSICLMAYMTW